MNRLNILFPTVLFLFSMGCFGEETVEFPKKNITVGPVKLTVEVASDQKQRARGLMFRKSLGENQGMLFVFPNESYRSFWMKNTFVPLSIGYFDKNKKLVDIQDMEPVKSVMQKNIPSYRSRKPAKYALEMQRGWFKKNGIKLGSSLTFEE